MREDLIKLAKQQAAEIARAGHNGWGNTMLALAAALESSAPVGVEAIKSAIAELDALRNAMFKTYAAAANGADKTKLIRLIEAERDAYEAHYSLPKLQEALAQQPAAVKAVEEALQRWLDWCDEHGEQPEAASGAATVFSVITQQPAAVDEATRRDADQLGPLPEQAGWCVLMHGHAAVFASNAERAVGLSCGATTPLFTADQMRAYAAQEVAAERERCAKLLRAVSATDCDGIRCADVDGVNWFDARDAILRPNT